MRNTFDYGVMVGLLSLVLVVLLGFGNAAWGQGASDVAPGAALLSAPAIADDGSSDVAVGLIVSEFPMLRLLSYAALVTGVFCGLLAYLWRRRRMRRLAITIGFVTTLLVAGLSFALFTQLALSPESKSCSSARLMSGAEREIYDDACREAREHAANAFGFVGVYRAYVMRGGTDATLPVSSGVVKTWAWSSLLTMSLLLYLILRPLALRLFVKR